MKISVASYAVLVKIDTQVICRFLLFLRDLLSSEDLLAHLKFSSEETSRWLGEETVITEAGASGGSVACPISTGSGRTYGWAQHLGGIQCLPHLESARDTLAPPSVFSHSSSAATTEPFGFIGVWFTALCRRLESRMSLNAEVRFHTFQIHFSIYRYLHYLGQYSIDHLYFW